MGAFSGASRSATVALAAMLACSIGATTFARAQDAASPAPSEAVPSAEQPAKPDAAPTAQAPADAAAKTDETVAAPDGEAPGTTPGAPPVADFKEAPKEEPVAAAPAEPQPPSDPQGAAVFARLADGTLLLPRVPAAQREALRAFYALGEFKPVWIVDRQFTPAAKSVIARLRAAAEDALDPAAYPVPPLGAAGHPETEAEIADADVRLSMAALLYARDARGGRINLAGISRLITPTLDLPSADALLPQLVGAGDQAGDRLQGYNPRTAGYLALKSRLTPLPPPAIAREAHPVTSPSLGLRVPVGPVLKVGMSDPRVPLLRKHFGLPDRSPGTLDDAPGEPDSYDQAVADAVAAFQRSRGLPANGNLTRATIVELAVPQRAEIGNGGRESLAGASRRGNGDADLIVNMERWRWLPGDLGQNYVLVNVPEFRLRAVRDGLVRDDTRVIVGKTESPTPLFSGMMEYAIVNPSWYVPPSILKQMLASGRTGGYEVVRRGNQISLRQPPGERNALGFIKFMFPNQHAVYLHDTPNRGLFSAAKRAMSHGCVRVDDPFRFADAVLTGWTSERLKKLIGKGERTIRLPEKLPVHLAYFTAYIDDAGVYRTLPDLYGYDARMRTALGLAGTTGTLVNRPVEPKRQIASVEASATRPERRSAASTAARQDLPPALRPAQRPVRREAVNTSARQPVRRGASDVHSEPGLWPPEPNPAPPQQGWW